MKYMPITLIATLSASLLYALIFVPTIGAIFAKKPPAEPHHKDGLYMWTVNRAIRHPVIVLLAAVGLMGGVFYTFSKSGSGVEFLDLWRGERLSDEWRRPLKRRASAVKRSAVTK